MQASQTSGSQTVHPLLHQPELVDDSHAATSTGDNSSSTSSGLACSLLLSLLLFLFEKVSNIHGL